MSRPRIRHVGVQQLPTQFHVFEMLNVSSYAENLSEDTKRRYNDKIKIINGLDPFVNVPGEPIDTVPPVEASDLVSYLVLQTSFVTSKQFKAHNSLDAYNQFVCGWVKDAKTWVIAGKYVTMGQVSAF